MKESTRKIFKAHGWRVDRAIHYYIYFKFYQPYVKALCSAFRMIEKVLSKRDPNSWTYRLIDGIADKASGFVFARYHGKVVTQSDLTKIINVETNVTLGPDTTRRIIPHKYATDILLNEPNQLAVMDCPCKAQLENPCQPLASCIAIGRPVTDFWLEHCRKYNARRITKEEALDIIDQHRKTGHFNQAFFKVATGGRMGVICNCCKKCCGGGILPMVARDYVEKNRDRVARAMAGDGGDPLTLKAVSASIPSGYAVKHDPEKCELCGKCAEMCSFSAIEIKDGQRLYDLPQCKGCGVCEEHCPNGALTLVYEDKGFIPLDLDLVREKLG